MRKSKLELYEDILMALDKKILTLDTLAYSCNMDCLILRNRLDFLIKNDVVEEKTVNEKNRYCLTRRGMLILRTVYITKRLQKLQVNTRQMDEMLRTSPALSKHARKRTKSP
jgi:predicted transcriptional regulator